MFRPPGAARMAFCPSRPQNPLKRLLRWQSGQWGILEIGLISGKEPVNIGRLTRRDLHGILEIGHGQIQCVDGDAPLSGTDRKAREDSPQVPADFRLARHFSANIIQVRQGVPGNPPRSGNLFKSVENFLTAFNPLLPIQENIQKHIRVNQHAHPNPHVSAKGSPNGGPPCSGCAEHSICPSAHRPGCRFRIPPTKPGLPNPQKERTPWSSSPAPPVLHDAQPPVEWIT